MRHTNYLVAYRQAFYSARNERIAWRSRNAGGIAMSAVNNDNIERLSRIKHRLTEWEQEFIESLANMDADEELSKKQQRILDQLVDKYL